MKRKVSILGATGSVGGSTLDLVERSLEASNLVVDGNADGLEESSKIGRAGAGSERTANCADEIIAGHERPISSATDDFACEPHPALLIGILPKDGRELDFVGGRHVPRIPLLVSVRREPQR